MNRFFIILIILLLSARISLGQTMEKDTIIITCLNGDSIAMAGLDSTKFYINNLTPPIFDISASNELTTSQPIAILEISLLSDLNQFKIEVITPLQDTIIWQDLFLEVSQAGNYTFIVSDLENGCVGVKNIDVVASDTVEYTPLVVENATWFMFNGEEDFTINTYWANKILGDTIIDGIDYKKLYYFECNGATLENINLALIGVLRENLNTRKVYGRSFNSNLPMLDNRIRNCTDIEESLIFDFDKMAGQQFEDCHVIGMDEPTLIARESNEYLYGTVRKVWQNENNLKLIEGIGYEDGLFLQPTSLIHAGHGYGLLGYVQDASFACEIPTSTNEQLSQKITIFPNPTTDFIQIQLSQPLQATVQLKTIAGQTISETIFNGLTHEIMVRDMPKGVYFLHLQAEEGYLVRRVIVQ